MNYGLKLVRAFLLSPFLRGACIGIALAGMTVSGAEGQAPATTLQGSVHDAAGKPVAHAVAQLASADGVTTRKAGTDNAGRFSFSALPPGSYRVSAASAALHSRIATVTLPTDSRVDLVLNSGPAQAMQFSDQADFTISGVTDWTAIGGHGSDSILRTSESLARDTVSLQPKQQKAAPGTTDASEQQLLSALSQSPGDFTANHRLGAYYLHAGRYREAIPLLESAWRLNPADAGNVYDLGLACEGVGDLTEARRHVQDFLAHHENADLHRLAAELDEKNNDPLDAVRQFELAARQDPSEQNYFAWGSELLLHRAVWQALDVFRKGAAAWPKSARLRTALGAALFAGARYDDAALRLCEASDLNPSDPQPYLFMGQVEMASPHPLPCIPGKLQRFLAEQPQSSSANYLYGMALLKQERVSPNPQDLQKAEALLRRSSELDPKNADAWLQLGILRAGAGHFADAIPLYRKAIASDPQLVEAHYRLAVAYDRTGQAAQAREEFQLHDRLEQQQAAQIERQRKEIKQFLITQPARADAAPIN